VVPADPEAFTGERIPLQPVQRVIVESTQPSFLFQNSVLITGEVSRTTDFETG